jgi:hypothetical protein
LRRSGYDGDQITGDTIMTEKRGTDSEEAARFALPTGLESKLSQVHSYWQGLKRGQADIPFADDVKLAPLGKLAADAILIDVFQGPPRFRFAIVGEAVSAPYGTALEGQFVDEVAQVFPIDRLLQQCHVTITTHAPTYWRGETPSRHARILLPLWGDGHISMILGGIAAAD